MKYFILFLASVLFFSSCSEFIETSVEDEKVILLAPSNQNESGVYTQNFWWQPVKNALSYRLQIVTPSFDSISRLIVDTLIKKDKFTFVLEPGKYEWRVRAENGSSQSAYAKQSFIIRFSSIKEQQLTLKSPAANSISNLPDAVFQWEGLFGATKYRFQLDTNNFEDEASLLVNSLSPTLEYSFQLSAEKVHRWRVRAENDTSQSKWSLIYKITYDKTPPDTVALTAPANLASVTSPVALQWSAAKGAKKYELLVLKSDSVSVYNSKFPASLTTTSYTFTDGSANEKIYWKIRAIDEAGNKGVYSPMRSFTVQ